MPILVGMGPAPSTQKIIRCLAEHAVRTWAQATAREQVRWVVRQATPPEGIVPDRVVDEIIVAADKAVRDARDAVKMGVVVPVEFPISGHE